MRGSRRSLQLNGVGERHACLPEARAILPARLFQSTNPCTHTHRAHSYHALSHLRQMFAEADKHAFQRPDLVALAIFFHECVRVCVRGSSGSLVGRGCCCCRSSYILIGRVDLFIDGDAESWPNVTTSTHDAPSLRSLIYNPRSGTNEEDSAERFRAFAKGASAWLVRVCMHRLDGGARRLSLGVTDQTTGVAC